MTWRSVVCDVCRVMAIRVRHGSKSNPTCKEMIVQYKKKKKRKINHRLIAVGCYGSDGHRRRFGPGWTCQGGG